MRCELAASLLHNPSIVFLDEPTIGLDIVVKSEIRDFLKELNQKYETTILLTTHDLQDIEALCSRVIMLDDGHIIYDGGLQQLKDKWGGLETDEIVKSIYKSGSSQVPEESADV